MKQLCLAVAVVALFGFSLAGQAVAAGTGSTPKPSSTPFEPTDYSSPWGGEGCSKPSPTS
ncbi:MAG: hypothetical protein JJ900_04480 [Rhodospirillales bacterium]|nr:hypothetical protein [Rhodospirillales bacterium]MBO6786086.1 hypothetical protein [Rhodospirillales bacterium]